MPQLRVKEPYTFEEAFHLYELYAEKYGHLGVVSLYFRDGLFTLTYYTD